MSKRFTETNKWQDGWFLSLPNDYRIIWLWLIDNCSIAGFWKKDFESLNFFCKPSPFINETNFKEIFNGRCLDLGEYFFIPKFLKVQYPQGLISNKPIIITVRKEIQKRLGNDYSMITQSLGNDYSMITQSLDMITQSYKVKVKVKEEDKEKKEGGMEGENTKKLFEIKKEFDLKDKKFKEFWELYPKRQGKRVGKAEAKKYFVAKIKDEEFLSIMQAVRNYASSTGCRNGYAKDAIRFLRQDFWKDWIEESKGGDNDGADGRGSRVKGQIDYSKYQTA